MLKKLLLKNSLVKDLTNKKRYLVSSYNYRHNLKQTLERKFTERCGYRPDIDHPTTYNEKLQYLKLYWHDPLAEKCADKAEVRDYVKECGHEDLLVPVIDVYNSTDDIDFEALPDKFILKGTHGSGMCIICREKRTFDENAAVQKMRHWLRTNYAYSSGEWVYAKMQRRIICEQLLEDDNGCLPCDYKIYCFSGVPKCVMVASGRQEGKLCMDFFTPDWDLMKFKRHNPNSDVPPEKPKALGEMLEIAKKLSKPFPHARIDLYYISGKIYFSEITFFPATGMQPFEPFEYDKLFGSWLDIGGIRK